MKNVVYMSIVMVLFMLTLKIGQSIVLVVECAVSRDHSSTACMLASGSVL